MVLSINSFEFEHLERERERELFPELYDISMKSYFIYYYLKLFSMQLFLLLSRKRERKREETVLKII